MIIASMFDESANALRPWAEAGHHCHAFDTENAGKLPIIYASGGRIDFYCLDLKNTDNLAFIIGLKPDLIMGWPPCTDMAVSGAMHFIPKAAIDPLFQIKSATLARTVEFVADAVGCPWLAENPVSVLATLWRKPNAYFHPFEYGGYLPLDDVHPRWPDYIAPRDAYRKNTSVWHGNGFIMPERKPVYCPKEYSTQHRKLGGKSAKTKQIRSEGPRGFLRAVFLANS